MLSSRGRPTPDAGAMWAVEVIQRVQSGERSVDPGDIELAVDSLVQATSNSYEREGATYARRRGQGTTERDEVMTAILLQSVRERVADGRMHANPDGRWKLLDVGAGPGRDLARFSAERDIEPVALENSVLFLDLLTQVAAERSLPGDAVVSGDMRDLGVVEDASFHCVRSNATLHHLPVVGQGVGADAAVAETRRVLLREGVFCVLVKAGDGVEMLDTKEGMGARFYQLFTRPLLQALLERNRFTIIHMEDRVSRRPTSNVQWIFCLAAAI